MQLGRCDQPSAECSGIFASQKDELDDKPNRWDAIQVLYEEPSEDVREMIASGNDYIVDAAWASKWLREGESNAETLGEADGEQGGE
jgi:hypothetical protein